MVAGVLGAVALVAAGSCRSVQVESNDDLLACDGATVVIAADGRDSGFVRCPDGGVDRVRPVTCDTQVDAPPCMGDEDQIGCHESAECAAGIGGVCAHVDHANGFGGPYSSCSCVYPCASDVDCGALEACVCRGVLPDSGWSSCVAADVCLLDSACASGRCGLNVDVGNCGWAALVCRSEADACVTDLECVDGARCNAAYSPHFRCVSEVCYH